MSWNEKSRDKEQSGMALTHQHVQRSFVCKGEVLEEVRLVPAHEDRNQFSLLGTGNVYLDRTQNSHCLAKDDDNDDARFR